MGYQPHEATAALEDSKNNLDGAIDRLTARQFGGLRGGFGMRDQRGGRGRGDRGHDRGHVGGARGGRGGPGRGGGRRGFDPDIEEDPRFDPVGI